MDKEKWTTKKPTEPGWYWVFGPENDEAAIALLDDWHHWYYPGFGEIEECNFTYEWFMGPLEIPDNPE